MKILSAEQIRKWDEYTIANEPISSLDLMERAATKCTKWLLNQNVHNKAIKIFCGKGNNGGDGLAIARLLAENEIPSEVYILEFGALGTKDFQANLSRLHLTDVPISFVQYEDAFPAITSDDIVIDALYGSGLNRPLTGLSASLVEHINAAKATVVSIDVPSGMPIDSSSVSTTVITATHTLTFQILKLCFLFPENAAWFGEITTLDISLHKDYLPTILTPYELTDVDAIKKIHKPRGKFSHKGSYGHSLIIAGEKGKMGAAALCTKACSRAGSGLVTSLVPEDQFTIIQIAVPEAMAAAMEKIESTDLSKYSAIGLGPGLGTSDNSVSTIRYVLDNYHKPLVIDADGLNNISQHEELVSMIPKESILTPHPKEFERLFGKTKNNFETLQLALQQAASLGIYIIVKGHYSFVACPDGQVYFNSTGNAGMATGGSGDVLTGIITGLLAQGYNSKDSCILGLYLHGLAGDIGAANLSQEALIAGDIVGFLGAAYKTISK
jgi:ADP-dependent NAD(P)H-hydrate dehydratase / NAD(P)H-hydrate epimerase